MTEQGKIDKSAPMSIKLIASCRISPAVIPKHRLVVAVKKKKKIKLQEKEVNKKSTLAPDHPSKKNWGQQSCNVHAVSENPSL